MFGIRDDLVIPLEGSETAAWLESWRWLLPPDWRPWFATALGDLFLRDAAAQVHWLDVGSGQLETVASDEAEFRTLLGNEENIELWFAAPLADQLRDAGMSRGPRECYSYVQLPILGGEYALDNFRVYDLPTHFQVWGPIHEKIKDLPDGATIEFRITE